MIDWAKQVETADGEWSGARVSVVSGSATYTSLVLLRNVTDNRRVAVFASAEGEVEGGGFAPLQNKGLRPDKFVRSGNSVITPNGVTLSLDRVVEKLNELYTATKGQQ